MVWLLIVLSILAVLVAVPVYLVINLDLTNNTVFFKNIEGPHYMLKNGYMFPLKHILDIHNHKVNIFRRLYLYYMFRVINGLSETPDTASNRRMRNAEYKHTKTRLEAAQKLLYPEVEEVVEVVEEKPKPKPKHTREQLIKEFDFVDNPTLRNTYIHHLHNMIDNDELDLCMPINRVVWTVMQNAVNAESKMTVNRPIPSMKLDDYKQHVKRVEPVTNDLMETIFGKPKEKEPSKPMSMDKFTKEYLNSDKARRDDMEQSELLL